MLRGWRLGLAIAAGLVVALRAALPWAIEKLAERQGSAALGVPVRVGDVDLSLVTGGVAIEELRVGNRALPIDIPEIDPAAAFLSLDRVHVRISWLDLLRGRIHLRELELDAPKVLVVRGADGRILPLPERAQETFAPASEPAETAGAGLPVAIDEFAMRSAHLGLSAAGQRRELLGFSLDELTVGDFALDRDGISLGAVGIRQPRLRVQRDLALGEDDPDAAPTPEPPPTGPAAPRPPFRARHIEIERAAFTLEMNQSELDVVLHLEADGVTLVRGETFPAKVSLEVAGGTLEADGTVGVDPPLFDGALHWRGIAVRPLLEPLPGHRIEAVDSATSSGDLKLAVALVPADGTAPELRVSGGLGLTDVKANVPGQELSVAWQSLDVEIDELRVPLEGSAPPRVALRKIRWVEPAVRAAIPAAAPEAEAQADAAPTPPVSAGPPAVPPQISLASLELVGGRIDLVDRSISPEYSAQIRKLNVGARDLRWPEGDVRDLRAGFTGPDQAVLDLRGGLRARQGELHLKVSELALAGFNPYAKSLAGVEVSRGNFSLDTTARATQARWDVQNDLRLHDVSLASGGSSVVPAVGLPISAVLALLRDPQGDISLGVPLQVDGAGARAGLGKIILGALRQTLVGLVSSPLKLLGFGAGAAGIGADAPPATLACTPGNAELASSEEERLKTIATLLSERPALALVLRGRAGGADSEAVAEQVLREAIEAGDAPELPDSGFLQRRRLRAALETRASGEPDELDADDREALARWIAVTPVPPQRLQTLAALRGELLLENLSTIHGIPRARLSLADPLEGEPAVALEIGAAATP